MCITLRHEAYHRPGAFDFDNVQHLDDSDFDSDALQRNSATSPILFLIFVNDLSCFLPHGRLISYADDTQILDSASPNPSELQALKSRAEYNVKCLQQWFSENSLKMNAGKTSFILLGTPRCIEKASNLTIQVSDTIIRPQKQIKVLGVVLDQTLSWESHISSLHLFSLRIGICSPQIGILHWCRQLGYHSDKGRLIST